MLTGEIRRRSIQFLGILGANLAVGALAGLAFLLYAFRGDPILAALPAVVALPAILVQPWFVLFCFLPPGGPFLAPILTTAVTLAIYASLDHRGGRLERAKDALLARLATRRAIVASAIAVLVLLAIGFARYLDFPALGHGMPKVISYSAKDLNLVLGSPRYCRIDGSIFDSQWVWRAEISERDLDRLADRLGLKPMPVSQVGKAFRRMPPYWWHPALSDRTRVLATPEFPMERGSVPDGEHSLATWNPDDRILHMWIKIGF